ncbi:hypothetical protein BDV96DRAFT_607536 [Lophiotrema nucula]|uniref:F-box domain-containing protein n=1 Tax=Lophiotrema nucula TaxID=690887 RepID=A0A6A5YH03_9PLEO|nr:hypothetical protein BDV96DRAFT_607536 [Lophiotrema nucula]
MFSCNLCGLNVGGSKGRAWASHIRAVYVVDDNWLDPRLSGLGLLEDPFDDVSLPSDCNLSAIDEDYNYQNDIHLEDVAFQSNGPLQDNSRTTGYVFHEHCFKLLRYACTPERIDARILNLLLRSFGVDPSSAVVNWGHTYGGFYNTNEDDVHSRSICRPRISGHPPGTTTYDKDPFLDRSFSQVLLEFHMWNHMEKANARSFPNEQPPAPPRRLTEECFEQLPVEILDMILSYLPSKDVLHARLSSRVVAAVPLSQAFWRSRFAPGNELDFLPEPILFKQKIVQHHFFSEPKLVHKAARDERAGLAMAQRQRIWDIIQPLANALRSFSLHGAQYGTVEPCGWPRASAWHPELHEEDQWRWDCGHGELLDSAVQPYHFGCRPLFKRFVVLPSRVLAIKVSVLPWYNTTYITGLRFCLADGSEVPLGYILADREETLKLDAGLRGFELAISERGIHGLNAATQGWKLPSRFVGDRSKYLKIARFGQGHEADRAKAYFDGMKMVYLAIPGYIHRPTGPYSLWKGAAYYEEVMKTSAGLRDV